MSNRPTQFYCEAWGCSFQLLRKPIWGRRCKVCFMDNSWRSAYAQKIQKIYVTLVLCRLAIFSITKDQNVLFLTIYAQWWFLASILDQPFLYSGLLLTRSELAFFIQANMDRDAYMLKCLTPIRVVSRTLWHVATVLTDQERWPVRATHQLTFHIHNFLFLKNQVGYELIVLVYFDGHNSLEPKWAKANHSVLSMILMAIAKIQY